jgi:hypothetical protein
MFYVVSKIFGIFFGYLDDLLILFSGKHTTVFTEQ